jgi:hypothetical protein
MYFDIFVVIVVVFRNYYKYLNFKCSRGDLNVEDLTGVINYACLLNCAGNKFKLTNGDHESF